MDNPTIFKKLFAAETEFAEAVLTGLTEDQLNWASSETMNPIGVTLLHLVGGDDFFIQTTILQQPTTWNTGGWAAKIGLAECPGGFPESWVIARNTHLPLAAVLACYRASTAATKQYLEQLTEAEIDRPVTMFGQPSTVGDMLIMILNHALCHLGEVAALKGVQGCKGLPY